MRRTGNAFLATIVLVLAPAPMQAMEKWHLALGVTTAALLTGSTVWTLTKNRSLMKAVEHNWTNLAQRLVIAGANVNYQEEDQEGHRSYTPLLWATEHGNRELVQFFLERGAVPAKTAYWKMTALHRAAIKGHYEIAQMLLDHGADSNALDKGKETPLVHALIYDHFDLALLLINRGADTHAGEHHHDRSPMELAITKQQPRVVQALLDKGILTKQPKHGRPGEPLIFTAIKKGTHEIVELFLNHDATQAHQPNGSKSYPLTYATAHGKYDMVKLLLRYGADVNAQKEGYGPALLYATARHDLPTINLLLAQPTINIDIRGSASSLLIEEQFKSCYHATALECAGAQGKKDIVELLLSKGALITHKLLSVIVNSHHFDMLKYLVEEKNIRLGLDAALIHAHHNLFIEVNTSNHPQLNRLNKLVDAFTGQQTNHEEKIATIKNIVMYLLRLDAQSESDKKFAYPLLNALVNAQHEAVLTDFLKTILHLYLEYDPTNEVLKRAYHNLNELSRSIIQCHKNGTLWGKKTIIELAAAEGKKDIVELLLLLGAPVDGDNYDEYKGEQKPRQTPLHAAAKNGHHDIVTVLLNHGANPQLTLSYNGVTALHEAADAHHENVIEALLANDKARANINVQDHGKHTPLYNACCNVNQSIIKKLITAGANVKLVKDAIFSAIVKTWSRGEDIYKEERYREYANPQNVYDTFALLVPILPLDYQDGGYGFSVMHWLAGVDKLWKAEQQDKNNQAQASPIPEDVRKSLVSLLLRHKARIDLMPREGSSFLAHATPAHVAALCKDKELLMVFLTKSYISPDTTIAHQHEISGNAQESSQVPTLQMHAINTITQYLQNSPEHVRTIVNLFRTTTLQAQELVIRALSKKIPLEYQQHLAQALGAHELFGKINAERHLDLVRTLMTIKITKCAGETYNPFEELSLDHALLKSEVEQHFQELFDIPQEKSC